MTFIYIVYFKNSGRWCNEGYPCVTKDEAERFLTEFEPTESIEPTRSSDSNWYYQRKNGADDIGVIRKQYIDLPAQEYL